MRHRAFALVLCGVSAAATAQPAGTAGSQQVDQAFRQLLLDPDNPGLAQLYATQALQAQDTQASIVALERLLLNPQAPAAWRVELGALYYQAGAYAMAETMLQQALEAHDLDAAYRDKANALLTLAQQHGQPSQFDGMLMLGIRTQSNPAARSDQDLILNQGVLSPLPDDFKPSSRTDIQALARVEHRYDLGYQNEATVVSSAIAQVVKFTSSSGSTLQANPVDPYNLTLLELNTGLRFKPMPVAASNLRLRPYLLFANVTAQSHQYLRNYGAGLEATYAVDARTQVATSYEYRHYTYARRIDTPAATEMRGPDHGLRLRVTHELQPGHVVIGEGTVRLHRTQQAQYDYNYYDARVTYATSYRNPLTASSTLWTTALWGSAARRQYHGPDPQVDASTRRRDTEWRIGLSQHIPLAPQWALVLQVEHTRTNANLPNFRFRNTAVLGAVTFNF